MPVKSASKKKTSSKAKAARICIACDSKKFEKYGEELVKCQSCGLVVAKDIPTFAELTKLYQEEYFFGMEYSDYKVDRPALEKNFKIRVKHLKKYIKKDTRVLEIGCAYGYFLNMIKADVAWHKGYDVTQEGIDHAVNELGVNATTTDFLAEKEVKANSIDLICMWDVIEHVGEPDRHIKKSAQLLKKGGAFCLTTGDIGAFVPKQRKDKWRMIHPPTHIYYFDVPSVTKLLDKYGLDVTSVRHKSTYRNAGSVFNQLIVNRKAQNKSHAFLSFTHKIAQLTRLDKINFPLNLYDVMEVTAVKR